MKKAYVWLASLFVSFALVSMGVMASAESVAQAPADVISEDVSFANTDSGLTLSGILYTPAEMTRDALNPAIIVTGPMLSVKEQAQSVYAQRLAAEGYVTLVFDYSTFGESEGEPRSLEVPDLKASDIRSAVTFLQGLSYVDDERIGGVGICGSGAICLMRRSPNRASRQSPPSSPRRQWIRLFTFPLSRPRMNATPMKSEHIGYAGLHRPHAQGVCGRSGLLLQ